MIDAPRENGERRDADELSLRLAHASRLAAMGELTASIAHELNQPISAILTNVDAAEMLLDLEQDHHLELRQVLNDIRNDSLRASEIIKHIRGLANKRHAELQALDVNELIAEVVRLASPIAARRQTRIKTDLAAVPHVHGDRIHMQQVLLNLIFNGMDAMTSMPSATRVLELATRTMAEGDGIVVSVRDHGLGIAPQHADRIFESFFTTKTDGMGLGLSIARTVVEAHGGRIWARNNPDGGATLQFSLPAATCKQRP